MDDSLKKSALEQLSLILRGGGIDRAVGTVLPEPEYYNYIIPYY